MKLKKYIETVKKSIKPVRPVIKGLVMVVIGILNTRGSIGIGRLSINYSIGLCSFLLLTLLALIIVKILKNKDNSSWNWPISINQTKILSIILWIVAICISVYYVLIYNLHIFLIIGVVLIGLLWFFLGFLGLKIGEVSFIIKIIISMCFSSGLVYGAIINSYIIPIFIWFFFIIVTGLQLSREYSKEFILMKREIGIENNPENNNRVELEKIFKYVLYFLITSIILLILSAFTNIREQILYLYPMILVIAIIGLTCFQ
ncbi:MAG: hypothetical protein GY870_10425, partial [archaeon]|nr:hypothetical protein [archaeon]